MFQQCPDITGEFTLNATGPTRDSNACEVEGAFSTESEALIGDNSEKAFAAPTIKFMASKSSAFFGNQQSVQPPSARTLTCIKI